MLDGTISKKLGNVFVSKPAFIHEDDKCMVFEEQFNPQAPIHFLVVPKRMISHFTTASGEDEKLLGHLILIAGKIAAEKGLPQNGFHMMVDEDHKTSRFKCLHVFGRALQHMIWPIGPASRL
ncbi:adenosine 5'-monophosphoramidase HINT1-like [Vanessa cardui]|uniref:adenosine 5'-monophosphoramidase HINT1-like n=1 Tax=Vanessa cardui TaxID=171605 RepID=UPI001F134C64|nr:adenosine 5'-monophosphoramidase HINT1-like [Vanessa cardui]